MGVGTRLRRWSSRTGGPAIEGFQDEGEGRRGGRRRNVQEAEVKGLGIQVWWGRDRTGSLRWEGN